MKVLKWFRYGFLSLGILIIFLILLPLPSFFLLDFDYSFYSFILYSLLSIIEISIDKKSFKPRILYYCGAIMSTIIFSGSRIYSFIRNLLNHNFSNATTDKVFITIVWVYHILAIVLLLTGIIWESIIVCKKLCSNNQKCNTLSKMFFSFGMMFLLIGVVLVNLGLLEPISYTPFTFGGFSTTVSCLIIISFVSFASMFILGLVYKILFLIKVRKERSIINVKE